MEAVAWPDGDRNNHRAYFDWCPTAAQIADSERWTLELEADDGVHQTRHDYLIVLEGMQP